VNGIPRFIFFMKDVEDSRVPLRCPLLLLLKFKSLRKAGCREMTHSDILIDGMSLCDTSPKLYIY
jgi:hypothetical protein